MTIFTLDWSAADIDGSNTFAGSGESIGVDIFTPSSGGRSWSQENVGSNSGLRGNNVAEPVSVLMTFNEPVLNIDFELLDFDSDSSSWDDQITVIALDADSNQVPVSFSNLAAHHSITGNVLNTDGNVSLRIEGLGAPDGVSVHISNPIVSLQVIFDNGADTDRGRTVGISDITFGTIDADDHMQGTSGDDVIDVTYQDGPEGDQFDNGDAVLTGAATQGDVVFAGAGGDTVYGDSQPVSGMLDSNALAVGTLLGNQFINDGVRISSLNPDHLVMVFDRDNPTGNDGELGTATTGKVLILSEGGDATDPDEKSEGGTFVFDFTSPAMINSFDFIDAEGGAIIRLFDEDGCLISTINVPSGANNAVQRQAISVAGVSTMHVEMAGAGAIDDLDYTIAPPPAGNDGVIYGGDGLYGRTGDDTIAGGVGADSMSGAAGSDGDPESGIVTFVAGETMTFSAIEQVVPCFTTGTMIATPRGERLVEDLEVGDRVLTRDNGIQTIVWVGHKPMKAADLTLSPDLLPIRISAGALGQGLPERDMLVSANHRVLIVSEMAQLYFEESEVLVAAKHLLDFDGVDVAGVADTTYVHFMFENHEIVLSDGIWTESFQPGDYTLRGVGAEQREEIFKLFPILATKEGLKGYRAARKSLRQHEAGLLLNH